MSTIPGLLDGGRGSHQDRWWAQYDAVNNFYKDNDRLPKRTDHDDNDRALASWVLTQRTCHAKGILSPDRQRACAKIPELLESNHDRWRSRIGALITFTQLNGPLSADHLPSILEDHLRAWVHTIRHLSRTDRLNEERTQACLEVPGLIDAHRQGEPTARAQHWEERLAAVERFQRQHHRLPSVSRDKDDPAHRSLAWWVVTQRRPAHFTRLSANQQRRLSSIPGFNH
jgi:hypothetical protein